jgi:hypothetical protein
MRSLAGQPRLNRESRTRSVSQAGGRPTHIAIWRQDISKARTYREDRPVLAILHEWNLAQALHNRIIVQQNCGFSVSSARDHREPLVPTELNSDPPAC